MRIAFVWDWNIVPEQTITWKDGLAAALKELINRGHEIAVYTMGEDEYTFPHSYFPIYVTKQENIKHAVQAFSPDTILIWGDTTRPSAKPLSELNIPMAMCFAGGHQDGEAVPFIEHFFVESQVYEDAFKVKGRSVSIAFGTNTTLFSPIPKQQKVFDALFPATFALWKRHDLFAKATSGLKACAVGYMYDTHEQECWGVCEEAGNLVLPHCSPEALQRLYAASKCVVVPSRSDGGSQRTVLEAMAMNIPLIVAADSDKTIEYLRKANAGYYFTTEGDFTSNAISVNTAIRMVLEEFKTPTTREFILQNYSEFTYADALEKGLKEIYVSSNTRP